MMISRFCYRRVGSEHALRTAEAVVGINERGEALGNEPVGAQCGVRDGACRQGFAPQVLPLLPSVVRYEESQSSGDGQNKGNIDHEWLEHMRLYRSKTEIRRIVPDVKVNA